jgi:acyl-CoA thioesterase-1
MGNRRGQEISRAWGISGVVAVAVLVGGLSTAALSTTSEPPASAGSVPELPTSMTQETTAPLRAVFIGDSYSAGAGSSGKAATFPQLVAVSQGWIPTNFARGGTGYLASSGREECGEERCPNYLQVLPSAVEADPDIVFVSGGRNDRSGAQAEQQIVDFYAQLRAELPEARIIATSPLWDDDDAPASLNAIATTVRNAVSSVDGTYLDIGQPLAGRSELMSADSIHPNDDGYQLIADTITQALPAS